MYPEQIAAREITGLEAEIERLRAAMERAADMLPANAACGVLRAALANEQKTLTGFRGALSDMPPAERAEIAGRSS